MIKEAFIVLMHAFIGWALCLGIIFMKLSYLQRLDRLIAISIIAPIVFILIATLYFSKFYYTSPIATASLFTAAFLFFDYAIGLKLIGANIIADLNPMELIPLGLAFLLTLLIGEKYKWKIVSKHR